MAVTALLREALEVPRHTERAGVAEVVERVGEDRYTTRVESTEELDDGEEEVQQEGDEDIPLRMMVVMMVMPMAVTVSMAMGMTVVVIMTAVVVVVIMFVSTHVSVLMLVLVGLHRSCLRYVN